MPRFRSHYRRQIGFCLALSLTLFFSSWTFAKKHPPPLLPLIRWEEGKPCCTFNAGEDGKYHFVLSSDDLAVTLSVDSQELQKVRRRPTPMIGVRLDVQYRGKKSLNFSTHNITLEFADHSHVIQSSLDPGSLITHLQNDMDAMNVEFKHQVQKHPETQGQQESLLQTHLKDTTEMIEFLNRSSLNSGTLRPGSPELSGWVFFSTKNKWIGGWKEQEHFRLLIPVEDKILEFPFTLPPKQADLILRRRPEQ